MLAEVSPAVDCVPSLPVAVMAGLLSVFLCGGVRILRGLWPP